MKDWYGPGHQRLHARFLHQQSKVRFIMGFFNVVFRHQPHSHAAPLPSPSLLPSDIIWNFLKWGRQHGIELTYKNLSGERERAETEELAEFISDFTRGD